MRMRLKLAILAGVLLANVVLAVRGGYSRFYALPASGELEIRNMEKNAVWRPCVLAVECPDVASRTVTIYRIAGSQEYPVTQQTATSKSYVYEFEGAYWSGLSNGVKVAVSPACTGLVEVIYE